MKPETWKEIAEYSGKVWAVVGPLAGVGIGAYLTGRRQKREWLKENKKEEYRELVAAITRCLSAYVQIYGVQTVRSGEDERTIMAADANFAEVVRSRLFIRNAVRHLKIAQRFMDVKADFRKNGVVELFITSSDRLVDEILAEASKDIGE
jgi:hypothetical protein